MRPAKAGPEPMAALESRPMLLPRAASITPPVLVYRLGRIAVKGRPFQSSQSVSVSSAEKRGGGLARSRCCTPRQRG